MENITIEIMQLEEASARAAADQIQQLTELQLAIVGGGGGDVVFA